MTNNFTDQLIKDYLVETYLSKAAANDTDRAAAEKEFKAELTNGPEKMVYYSGKGAFPKKVGSFDLTTFHKAYDKWFEDNSLLDIFTDDGRLINRGTYGRFASLNKAEPAVKALGQLWGAQFKDDIKIVDDASVIKKAQDDYKKLVASEIAQTKDVEKKVVDQIKALPEYKNLIDQYPEEIAKNIDVKATAECRLDRAYYITSYDDDSLYKKLEVEIVGGVLREPQKGYVEYPERTAQISFTQVEITKPSEPIVSWDDIIEKVLDHFKTEFVELTRLARAAFYFNNNYNLFIKLPEFKLTKIDDNKFNWFGYYNPDNNKYYKTKLLRFPYKLADRAVNYFDGLMLINVDDDKDRAAEFSPEFRLVCARYNEHKYSHESYMHYEEAHQDDYYKSRFPDSVLKDKFGIHTVERHDVGMGETTIITKAEPPFSAFFDRHSAFGWFIDSSD